MNDQTIKKNKRSGLCYYCRENVREQAGYFVLPDRYSRDPGWRTVHVACFLLNKKGVQK